MSLSSSFSFTSPSTSRNKSNSHYNCIVLYSNPKKSGKKILFLVKFSYKIPLTHPIIVQCWLVSNQQIANSKQNRQNENETMFFTKCYGIFSLFVVILLLLFVNSMNVLIYSNKQINTQILAEKQQFMRNTNGKYSDQLLVVNICIFISTKQVYSFSGILCTSIR